MKLAERLDVLGGHSGCPQPCRLNLQDAADRIQLEELVPGETFHDGAAVWEGLHEAELLQPLDCLPHRHDAGAQLLSELADLEPLPRSILASHDRIVNGIERLVSNTLGRFQLHQCHGGHFIADSHSLTNQRS